jgi:D-methionine transport system ATP-binding protein
LSGAGKSTLVRCINGLEKFDSGNIYFHGEIAPFNRSYRRKVAMIFQSFNLLEQRNVLKNVELADEINPDTRLPKEERKTSTESLLRRIRKRRSISQIFNTIKAYFKKELL